MTKKEFNRVKNFLDERGTVHVGYLIYVIEPKINKQASLWFGYVSISGNNFIVDYINNNSPTDRITIHRKYISRIDMKSMDSWYDLKGEREKKLSKIL